MIRKISLIPLLALFAVSSSQADTKPLQHPQVPMFGLVRYGVDLPDSDIKFLAENYKIVQGIFTPEQVALMRKINPEVKIVEYTNSSYTRSAEDVAIVEQKHREGIAMTPVATLDQDIDAKTTSFKVVPNRKVKQKTTGNVAVDPNPDQDLDPENAEPVRKGADEDLIAIRASTVEGDYSSAALDKPGTQHYVFWIRIGDELMRVNKFDPTSGAVEVARGFDKSKAVAHKKEAHVFSPIYLGFKRLHIDKYPGFHPGGPGNRLRYVLDPQSDAGNIWKAEIILEMIEKKKFDGGWLDILSSGTFNMSDALGRAVQPWNFSTDAPCLPDEWREYQEKKIHFVQEYIKNKTGKYPYLIGNNIKVASYEVGKGGEKMFLVPTKIKPRPMDGMVVEYFVEPTAHLMDAAKEGLTMLARVCPKLQETPERERMERYAYANYLLCKEKGDKTMFGTEALISVTDTPPDKVKLHPEWFWPLDGKLEARLHPQYYWPIGEPTETAKVGDLDHYLVKDTTIRRRNYSNGIVLVNTSKEKESTLKLEKKYFDPDTKQEIESITIPADNAKILLIP